MTNDNVNNEDKQGLELSKELTKNLLETTMITIDLNNHNVKKNNEIYLRAVTSAYINYSRHLMYHLLSLVDDKESYISYILRELDESFSEVSIFGLEKS